MTISEKLVGGVAAAGNIINPQRTSRSSAAGSTAGKQNPLSVRWPVFVSGASGADPREAPRWTFRPGSTASSTGGTASSRPTSATSASFDVAQIESRPLPGEGKQRDTKKRGRSPRV